jgi:hypothetical protein
VNLIIYDESLVASTGLSFFWESSMSQFHDQHEEVGPQDGRRLGAERFQADHARNDLTQKAEASQRNRWVRFLARQIARDILRQNSVKEDTTP